jgi:hypothetical protein
MIQYLNFLIYVLPNNKLNSLIISPKVLEIKIDFEIRFYYYLDF